MSDGKEETATQSGAGEVQFGYINPVDSGIAHIIYLLAQDPAYSRMPLERVQEVILAIHEKRYLAAVNDKNCIGALLYVTISSEAARQCIIEGRQPRKEEIDPKGSDVMLTAMTGKALNLLVREFRRLKQGSLILYERHYKQGRAIDTAKRRLGWFDRKGILGGRDGVD